MPSEDVRGRDLPDDEVPPVREKADTVIPEGGLAGWLSVVGCSCAMFSTFGFLNA
jgi:hypothetical protein